MGFLSAAPFRPERVARSSPQWLGLGLAIVMAGMPVRMLAASPSPAAAAGSTVLVAVADEWCPYTCAEDAPQEGYLVDLLRAVFEPLGYRVDYRVMPWPRALRETQLGRANVAMGATPANARDLVLPKLPAGRDESTFVVRADSTWRYAGIPDLAGITLGVTADYTYFPEIDDWIERNRQQPDLIDIATGDAPLTTNLRKLESGRIDAFIENRNVLLHAAARHPTRLGIRMEGRIPGDDIVVGFSPFSARDAALAGVFDERVRQLRESGELAAILGRYGLEDWVKGSPP